MVERLIGLDGRAPMAAGLYFPESLVEPGTFVDRLQTLGVTVKAA